MKKTLIHHLNLALLAASLLACAAPNARAGGYIFAPTWTQRTIDSLKPEDQVRIKCGKCGAVAVVTYGKDGSVLKHYKCEKCGAEYHVKGRAHGRFALVDDRGYMAEISVPVHAPLRSH